MIGWVWYLHLHSGYTNRIVSIGAAYTTLRWQWGQGWMPQYHQGYDSQCSSVCCPGSNLRIPWPDPRLHLMPSRYPPPPPVSGPPWSSGCTRHALNVHVISVEAAYTPVRAQANFQGNQPAIFPLGMCSVVFETLGGLAEDTISTVSVIVHATDASAAVR